MATYVTLGLGALGWGALGVGAVCGSIMYSIYNMASDYTVGVSGIKTSNYTVIALVAKRLEEIYGGKAHLGLQIPDPDTGSQQKIDIVLVTNGEAVVISVKNFSGLLLIKKDSSWSCWGEGQLEAVLHPDPVAEVKRQVSILESYLEQRGFAVQQGCLSYKVILPNPKLRCFCQAAANLPEVIITYDRLMQLKPEHHELNYIIGTAPTWDRLELEGNELVWGEFLEFKGQQEDIWVMRYMKRSKVSHLTISKLTPLVLQVSYSPRDFRSEGALEPEWKKIRVRPNIEVLFQPHNSTEVKRLQLSSIMSLSLSV